MIRFRDFSQQGDKGYSARVVSCDPLSVVQAAYGVRKIMESSEDVSAVEIVLRHGRMFQGSDEIYKPLLYHSDKRNSLRMTCLYSAEDFEIFLQLLLQQWSRYRCRYWVLDSRGLLDLLQEQ